MTDITQSDSEELDETAYLLRSPANAKRLLEAINRDPKEYISFASVEDLKRHGEK